MFKLNPDLYQHQITGIEKSLQVLQKYRGFMNYCEQGTGKTLMTIGAMNVLRLQSLLSKVLIVCPNNLKYNWQTEIEKMSSLPWDVVVLSGPTKNRYDLIHKFKGNVIITNYETLTTLTASFIWWAPDLIIADESHYIKTPGTKRTKTLKKIKCDYKIGMTGTPMTVSPLDVWSPVDWAIPGYLNTTYYGFRNTYANVYTGRGYPQILGYRDIEVLQAKIDLISYRVIKSQCLDLPPKVYQTITFDLDLKERRAYDQMAKQMITEIGDMPIPAANAAVKLNKLSQITGGTILDPNGTLHPIGESKLKVLGELLEGLEHEKVIIFALYKADQARIVDYLEKSGRKVLSINSNQTEEEAEHAKKTFQSSPEPYAIVISIKLGSVGITLTAASFVVYFSNSFSLADRAQSEDRAHRIGQTRKVTYYDLVARKTIDSYVIKSLQKKQTLSDMVSGDDLRRIAFDE